MKTSIYILLIAFVGLSALKAQNPMLVPGSSSNIIEEMVEHEGNLYYYGIADPGSFEYTILKKVSPGGTASANLLPSSITDIDYLLPLGDRLYFRAKSPTICNAWTLHYYSEADGVVALTNSLYPLGVPAGTIFGHGGELYVFGAVDCVAGADDYFFWRFDGSTFTIVLAPDISFNGLVHGQKIVEYNGKWYYSYFDLKCLNEDLTASFSVTSSIWSIANLSVHNGKLYFSARDGAEDDISHDLYSYDGATLIKEYDFSSNENGVLDNQSSSIYTPDDYAFVSDGSDLYFWASTASGGGFYRFDGTLSLITPLGSVSAAFLEDELYYVHDGLIARTVDGFPRPVTTEEQAATWLGIPLNNMQEFDGALYYYHEVGTYTIPETPFTPGLYRYREGTVLDGFDLISTGDCDPETSTIDIEVEIDYHGSLGGGTFDFVVFNGYNDDTLTFSVAETSPPQLHTFTLPVVHPTSTSIADYTILTPKYSSPLDPNSTTVLRDVLGSSSDGYLEIPIPLPCIPCGASVNFLDQDCTYDGHYEQSMEISWDPDYTPFFGTEPVFITVNWGMFGATGNPAPRLVQNVPATGGYATFDIFIEGVSSVPCTLTDSVITPYSCATGSVCPINNATCETAKAIGEGTITQDVICGGDASSVCFDTDVLAERAVWFAYTATETTEVTVSSSIDLDEPDTRLSIYSGSCDALTCLSSDDDGGEGYTSIATFSATAGETYLIEWDDRWDSGEFDFEVSVSSTSGCMGDINGDGEVDISDFIGLNSVYGTSCVDCPEDIDGDGSVGINDFLALNSDFGADCSTTTAGDGPQMLHALSPDLENDLGEFDASTIHPDLYKLIQQMSNPFQLTIYPNPLEGGTRLNVQVDRISNMRSDMRVSLTDPLGRILHERIYESNDFRTTLEVDLDRSLAKGIYLVVVEVDGRRDQQRLLVE